MKTLFLVYSSTESLQKQDFRFKFWTENRVKHCFKLNSRPFLPSRLGTDYRLAHIESFVGIEKTALPNAVSNPQARSFSCVNEGG